MEEAGRRKQRHWSVGFTEKPLRTELAELLRLAADFKASDDAMRVCKIALVPYRDSRRCCIRAPALRQACHIERDWRSLIERVWRRQSESVRERETDTITLGH